MKARNIRIAVIAIILIAGVALGVHLMHKDAMAITYQVNLWDDGEPLSGYDVDIRFFVGGIWLAWEDMPGQDNGSYLKVRGTPATHWQVRIMDEGVTFVDLDESPFQPPDLLFTLDWEIIPPPRR
jgi:hypothetical protein